MLSGGKDSERKSSVEGLQLVLKQEAVGVIERCAAEGCIGFSFALVGESP